MGIWQSDIYWAGIFIPRPLSCPHESFFSTLERTFHISSPRPVRLRSSLSCFFTPSCNLFAGINAGRENGWSDSKKHSLTAVINFRACRFLAPRDTMLTREEGNRKKKHTNARRWVDSYQANTPQNCRMCIGRSLPIYCILFLCRFDYAAFDGLSFF